MKSLTLMTHAKTRLAPYLLAMAVLGSHVAISGCALSAEQKAAVAGFSEATVLLTELSADLFVKTREDVVALRTEMLELGSGSVDLNVPHLDLDGPLDLDQLQKRLQALEALQEFAVLIQQLAVDDQTGRMGAATDSFLSSLGSLEGVNISDEQAGAIQAAVMKIAGIWVEHNRKLAIQRVVVDTKKPISSIIRELSADFDPQALYWVGALAQHEGPIKTSLGRKLQRHVAGETLRDPDDEDSPRITEADIALLHSRYETLKVDYDKRMQAIRELSRKMRRVLELMEKAHHDLVTKVQADIGITDLKTYIAEVKELSRLGKLIIGK